MRRQLALQFALAAALGFGGLLTLPVIAPHMAEAQAQEEKRKKEKPSSRKPVARKCLERRLSSGLRKPRF